MINTFSHANKWLEFLNSLDLPDKNLFKKHVLAGAISSLCECGCNSFEYHISSDVYIEPLTEGSGLFYEIAFSTNMDDVIDFLVFTDDRGYFSGVDITYGFANHTALPDGIVLKECVHSQSR